MYSQEALDIANEMNLKKLSQVSYDQKYPRIRIENCVRKVYEMFLSTIVPFFDRFNAIDKIYEEYAIENPTNVDLNPLEIGKWDSKELHFSNLMFLNLLCAKYNRQKPLILSQYSKHRQSTNEDTLKLIDKIENYKFE